MSAQPEIAVSRCPKPCSRARRCGKRSRSIRGRTTRCAGTRMAATPSANRIWPCAGASPRASLAAREAVGITPSTRAIPRIASTLYESVALNSRSMSRKLVESNCDQDAERDRHREYHRNSEERAYPLGTDAEGEDGEEECRRQQAYVEAVDHPLDLAAPERVRALVHARERHQACNEEASQCGPDRSRQDRRQPGSRQPESGRERRRKQDHKCRGQRALSATP